VFALAACVSSAGACVPAALTLEADGGPAPGDDGSPSDSTSSSSDVTGDGGSDAVSGDGGSHADAAGNGDAGCTCIVAAGGTGWSVVAFDPVSRSSCPAGYASPSDVIVDPTSLGPSTCTCVCDITSSPSCVSGLAQLTYGSGGTCTTSAGGYDVADGGCVATTLPFAAEDHQVTPPPPSGGSCTSMVTEMPPSPGGGLGKMCTATSTTGGCGTGKVCAPGTNSLFLVCVAHAGDITCPSGYTKKHSVGTGITGGGCGTCSCVPPSATCSGATFTVFADSQCASSIATVPADGVCHAVTGGGDAGTSYQYSATTTNVACTPPTQPQPTGNSTLTNLTTVCCP
jgi:hypothetical protein